MSVERIALDIKVAAQELVEALAGKEALPTLAEVQACSNNVSVQHRPIAVPNMYSTCIQPLVMICWHIAARVCMNHSTKHNSSMTSWFHPAFDLFKRSPSWQVPLGKSGLESPLDTERPAGASLIKRPG